MGVEARKTAAKIYLTEGSRVPISGKQEGARVNREQGIRNNK
jgi:hypothetical protein